MKQLLLRTLLLLVPFGASAQKPNILIFLADDLGWADLGCYGSTLHETPHLDRLAREGLTLTQAYAAASLCSPTRASIMTGKHPARVNITDWIPGAGDEGRALKTPEDIHNLPLSELTIGEAFKEAGYETYYAGKWHLGDPQHGADVQGFDQYIETAKRWIDQDGQRIIERKPPAKGERQHLTQFLTRQTTKYLAQRKKDTPFFAFVSYHDVHTPVRPDRRFIDHYKKKATALGDAPEPIKEREGFSKTRQDDPAYATMVHALDQSVGTILKSLADANLADNTIVIFTSDNGGLCTKRKPGPTSNLPLRAGKGWLYEGGTRIPFMIRYPGKVPAGRKSNYPLVTTDLYSTLLALADLPQKPAQHRDSQNLALHFLGTETAPPSREIHWHFPHYHGSLWTPGSAIRDGDWKLIEFYEKQDHELYHLAKDPSETNNLTDSHPKKAAELLKKLHRWQKDIGAKLPTRRETN